MTIILNAAGGLGIFLLAMAMMTDGLKVFGGERLKSILEFWTSSPIRAVLAGAMVTGMVQSSSAVTVATIGFVNAGILTLQQALGVVFGANVGTTMTGWLVSTLGFGFKIESLALPIIALGVALRMFVQGQRLHGLGEAIAGFGLFFLGIWILKDAFSGVAETFGTTTLNNAGAASIVLFVFAGFVATVLTQSSSAAIALILTASNEAALGLGAGAAAVIGANIGTTSTAAFAAIRATPNARRVAAGHIAFNLCTGVIALLLLPVLLGGVDRLGRTLGMEDQPAVFLALFHTVFNVLGVALLLPFIGRFSRVLSRMFVTSEEEISRPQFLDNTVARTPAFAVLALRQELLRMHELVVSAALSAVDAHKGASIAIQRRSDAMLQLGKAVTNFAVTVRMGGMSRAIAETLPLYLRISRYLEEAARLLDQVYATSEQASKLDHTDAGRAISRLLLAARACLVDCREGVVGEGPGRALATSTDSFESVYQETKAQLLSAAASHQLSIERVDQLLDATSRTRRMVEQVVKATTALRRQKDEFDRDDNGVPETGNET